MSVQEPKWIEWPPTRAVALWEAALLCLNIDPMGLEYRPGVPLRKLDGVQRRDFLGRLNNILSVAGEPG